MCYHLHINTCNRMWCHCSLAFLLQLVVIRRSERKWMRQLTNKVSSGRWSFCCVQVTYSRNTRKHELVSDMLLCCEETLGFKHAGVADGSDVTQTDILWKNKGDSATIDCSHTKGASYFYMYWFRQLPGETMKLIVSTTPGEDPDFGNFSKEKFSATKTKAESGTFTVKNLEAADRGLYFCAVSEHNDADVSGSRTETILSSDAHRFISCSRQHTHHTHSSHTLFAAAETLHRKSYSQRLFYKRKMHTIFKISEP